MTLKPDKCAFRIEISSVLSYREKKAGPEEPGPASQGVVKPSRAPRQEREGMELIRCYAPFSCHALRVVISSS